MSGMPTPMAGHVRAAAWSLAQVIEASGESLPDSEGRWPDYPFSQSLDEIVATLNAWADRLADAGA